MIAEHPVSRYQLIIQLTAILFLASAYRLYHLTYYGLSADEMWGINACSLGGVKALVTNMMLHDNHPPGYQTLLYFWIKMAGTSDLSMRLPSALVGIASVLAIFRMGTRHFNSSTGLLAACLLAGSFWAIYYSQDARAYSPLILLTILSTSAWISLFIDKSERKCDWWLFWVSSSLMIYQHYAGAVYLFAEGLLYLATVLVGADPKRDLTRGIKAFSPVLIVYSPWLPTMYRHATTLEYWAAKPDLLAFQRLWDFIFGYGEVMFALQAAAVIITPLLWLYLKRSATTHDDTHNKALTLLAMLLCPMAIFFAKSIFSQSIHEPHHFIYAIPISCLLTGYVLEKTLSIFTANSQHPVLITMLLITIAAAQFNSNMSAQLYTLNRKQEIRQAAELPGHDQSFLDSHDIIISSHNLFRHYLNQQHIDNSEHCCFYDAATFPQIQNIIQTQGATGFYFLEMTLPDKSIRTLLKTHYRELCSTQLQMVEVSKFSIDLTQTETTPLPDCRL